MSTDDEKRSLEFYGSKYFALVPFVVFLGVVVWLSLTMAINLTAMIGGGVAGMIVGAFFARNWEHYWGCVQRGFTQQPVAIAFSILLVAGIFANLMGKSGLAGGLVWIADSINLTGAWFTGFAFVGSAVLALATGTSIGTIATMTPVLFPAGLIVGCSPVFLAGAILSGAALGDNVAPVSDTTILSAATQRYRNRPGTADVGGVVRTRIKYALLAGIPALILYLIVGGGGTSDPAQAAALLAEHSNPRALWMLIPIVVVIYIAVRGRSIFLALAGGIVSGAIVGFITGLLSPADFMQVVDGNVAGIITEGVGGMFEAAIIVLVIIGMLQILTESGVIDALLSGLSRAARTARSAELVMFLLTSVWDGLAGGVNSIVVAITGPLNSEIGSRFHLHPYRRANITDATSNTLSFFLPWCAFIFIFSGIAEGLLTDYPFVEIPNPASFFFAVFYSLFLWFVMLIACLTGFGRAYEGPNGEHISEKEFLRMQQSKSEEVS